MEIIKRNLIATLRQCISTFVCLSLFSLLLGSTLVSNADSKGSGQSTTALRKFYVTNPVSGDSGESGAGVDVPLHITPRDGFCYLTAISGAFHGGGELVRILQENGEYFLHITTGDVNNHIHGEAQCVTFAPLKTEAR